MEYCWDIKNIKKKIYLLDKDNKKNSKYKKIIYSRMIDDMNGVVYKNKKHIEKNEFFYKLGIFDTNYFNHYFFNIVKYLISNIKYKEYSYKYHFEEKLPVEEVIKLCNNFYRKVDKTSFTYFKKIISHNNSFQYIKYNQELSFIGRTYICPDNEYYILINPKNYLESVSATVHECKHVETYLKGYNKGISLYQELPSILYELYSIDFLKNKETDKDAVRMIRLQNIDKYIKLINKMYSSIELINNLLIDNNLWNDLYKNYDLYYDEYNIDYIYSIVNSGFSEIDIGIVLSFILAIDIYTNCNINNVNNVISCYMFGMYSIKPKSVDNAIKYINDIIDIESEKSKKYNKEY